MPRRLCGSLYEGSGCACLAVKTTPAKTALSLSNIDSAHFTKDDFDPSNDIKSQFENKASKGQIRSAYVVVYH